MTRARPFAIVQAVVLFFVVEAALRAVGTRRAARWFGARFESGDSVGTGNHGALLLTSRESSSLAGVELVARRWPFGPPGGCLRESLAAAHVLRRHEPCIRVAVEPGQRGTLAAHAWLEVAGVAATDRGTFRSVLSSPARHVGP